MPVSQTWDSRRQSGTTFASTHRPAEDVPCLATCDSSRLTKSFINQEGLVLHEALIYDNSSIEKCSESALFKKKTFVPKRLGFQELHLRHPLMIENEKVKAWERKLALPWSLFFKQLHSIATVVARSFIVFIPGRVSIFSIL